MGRTSWLLDSAVGQAFCPLDKGLVKGAKGILANVGHKMDSICKVKPLFIE